MKKYIGLIGLILFLILLIKLNLFQIISIISSANVFFIALSFIPMLMVYFLKAFRWKTILSSLKIQISFTDILIMSLIGYFYGSITPGNVGDFIRSKYLSNVNSIPLGESFSTVFVERIFDLMVIFYIGFIGVLYLMTSYKIFLMPIYLLVLILIISISFFYVVLNEKILLIIIFSFFLKAVPKKYTQYIEHHINDFVNYLKLLITNKHLLIKITLLSIIIWLFACLGGYCLILSLGAPVSFPFIVCVMIISTLISLIPISVNGLGTRELTIISLFSIIHLNPEFAFSFSVMVLAWILLSIIPGMILFFVCKKEYLTI